MLTGSKGETEMNKRTVTVRASEVESEDNCLYAAEDLVARNERLQDWQTAAAWTDDDRDTITVTITD